MARGGGRWLVLLAAGLGMAVFVPAAVFGSGVPEAGFTRADFGNSCGACHGDEPTYPVLGAKLGYDTSGHRNNGNSYYANGGGCQRCHTNEGFIAYVKTGSDNPESFVRYPSQQGCFTCHTPHETWNFALRTEKPVKLETGVVFDLGEGNLCANCHQARGTAKTTVTASAAKDILSHYGAHHGPQADVMMGTNAWEYPGKTYSNSPHTTVVSDGCVTCHMSLPEGRYAFSPSLGGHSFNIVAEVHEVGKVNNSGCLACHPNVQQVRGTEIFDIKAAADYDQDGKIEPVQVEVEGLLQAFVNPNGTGYLQKTNPPMYAKDGSWANSRTGNWSEKEMAALYNYKFFLEDRSKGVHNTVYTVQVLYDSLKSLDPRLNDSLRPR